MARINAGLDFGQSVAQPVRMNEVATPRAAFGVPDAVEQTGAALERQGAQDMQAAQVMQQRQAQRDAAEQIATRQRADAAAAQSKLLGMRDSLADALDEIDRGVQDGSIAKADARKTWDERSQALIADGIADLPEEHRQLVQTDISGMANRLSSKVADSVRRRDQSDIRSSIDATLEHAARLAIQDPERARSIVDATLDANGAAAGLRPEVVAKLRQNWIEGSAYTRAFSAVSAAKNDNRLLATVEQSLQGNQEIDPQKKAVLLAQVENFRAANEARALRQAQHAEIVAARRQRESDSAFSTLSAWALSGRMANPDAAAGLLAKLTPEAATAYREMVKDVPQRTALAMRTLPEMDQYLDALNVRAQREGMSKPLEDEIQRAQKVRDEARKDYAAEPLRAANERGVLDTPLQPVNVNDLASLPQALATRVEQARTVQTRTGRPVSPFLTEEAGKIEQMLNALPAEKRSDWIAAIAEVMPPEQMGALAKQIDPKNRALYLQMAVGAEKTASGQTLGRWIARGAQALKDKAVKEDDRIQLGLRAKITALLPDSMPQQWREDVVDAARLLYVGQKATPGYSPTYEGALRLALGGNLIEHNGAPLPVIGGDIDAPKFRQRLTAAAPAQVQRQAGAEVYVDGRAMPAADFLARLPDARLAPLAPGFYAVEAGSGYAMTKNRRPVVIEVR